ncbi:MAG: polyprenyl synthetase family protein [Prevotellaceae bacterium]|nr:polyprenyl synthetase family protein [Prevotellaceae bacterium]
MSDTSIIRQPIEKELDEFIAMFRESLSHSEGMLNQALTHILNRAGKMMRPMLVLLIAKNYSEVSDVTLNGALGLELLHTASLVHDDVVDESLERRGQPSINATYNNKVSILVGDYILSTALIRMAKTHNNEIVSYLAQLGRVLSQGEIDQLSNITNQEISEDAYFNVIRQKTAALFAACAKIGALSANATKEDIDDAENFGETLGLIFQIKDDIFDYYESGKIGKPTGNDMIEGKLTLPAIHALLSVGDEDMMALARKVKARTISPDEIARLVDFTKQNNGIAYAEEKMEELKAKAQLYVKKCRDEQVKSALNEYLNYVIERKY